MLDNHATACNDEITRLNRRETGPRHACVDRRWSDLPEAAHCASINEPSRRQGGTGMRIAILGGGGAMGGMFGGYLARAGNDVTLIDVSKAAIEAINDNGLTIEEKDGSPAGDRACRPATIPASVGPVDLIINFVKCYHTEAAVRAAAPMIGPGHRRAQPAERLGQRAAHRLDRRRGPRAGRPHLPQRHAARAGPGQASGRRHDLSRRARRQADRPPRSGRRHFRAARASRRRCPTRSSTRSGRSWRSTPARCRPPALLHFFVARAGRLRRHARA